MRKLPCQLKLARLLPLTVVVLAAVAVAPAVARPVAHNGRIAFARYDPVLDAVSLYTVNPDGTQERQLLPLFGGLPHWSPDGTQIASPVTESGPGATITDADTGDSVQFPNADPSVDPFCYAWSPDAERLACETYGKTDRSLNGVYTIRSSDGGGLMRLTSTGGGDHPGDYSPDGKRLVYTHFAGCCDLPREEWMARSGVFVVNVNGTGNRKIAPCCASLASWSPKGNQIVFSRRAGDDVHSSIWVVHSDGSGLHEVDVEVPAAEYPCGAPVSDPNYNPDNDPTVGGCFDPAWSPDGKKIVFVRGDDALGRNVYTVNADGTGLTQVTNGGADQSNGSPDWGVHPLVK